MPLQTQNVDLRFASGVDTKTDQNNVLFTSFQELKNSRIDKIGAVVPRGGFVAGSNIYPVAGYPSYAIASNGAYTVVGTNASLRLQSSATSANMGYNVRGGFLRIPAGRTVPFTSGTAAGNNTICHVWLAPDIWKVNALVISTVTNEVILRAELPMSTTALSAKLHVVYVNSGYVLFMTTNATIQAWDIPTNNYSNSGVTAWTISSGAGFPISAGPPFRFDVTSVSNRVYIVYSAPSATTVNVLKIVDNGPGNRVGSMVTVFTMNAAAICPIVIPTTVFGAEIAVFSGSELCQMQGALLSSSLVVLNTNVSTGTPAAGTPLRCMAFEKNGEVTCKFDILAGSGFWRNSYIKLSPLFPSFAYDSAPSGAVMTTGPITIEDVLYSVLDANTATTYGSYVLARHDTSVASSPAISGAARFGSGKNLGLSWSATEVGAVPRPVVVGSKIYFPMDIATGIDSIYPALASSPIVGPATTVIPYVTASLLQWDLNELVQSHIATANNESLYIGSAPRDVGVFEGPGVPWPECTMSENEMTMLTGSTGVAPAGVVNYVFAKLYTSPSGVEYRTYSQLFTYNSGTAANKVLSVLLSVDNLKASEYLPATLELYRTERNGTTYYRCASITSAITGPIVNGTFTWVDNYPESQLIQNRIADINGGELFPESMPAIRCIASFKSRLAYVDVDDPNIIKFDRGTPAPSGTTATSGISVELTGDGGKITGLHQMDGALYVFKSNSIWSIYGEVPNATGEGGNLSTPTLVFNGVGCDSARSIVLTSKGLLFKGAKGIYLLMRNQELTFMGQGPYNDRTVNIVGSGIGENQAEAYFVHSDGKVWVFNTDLNAWYEWTYSSSIRAAVIVNKALTVLSDTETASISLLATADQPLFPDPATPIVQDLMTGWIRMTGIQGYQRVKKISFLIDALAATTMTIDVYCDYNDTTPFQTVTVNTNDLAIGASGVREFELHLKQQKSSSTKFRIRTAGYGVKLSGATLTVATKDGLAKNTSNTY